ncbi:hypothetical protein AAC387_Pa10g1097 [Persea americana]
MFTSIKSYLIFNGWIIHYLINDMISSYTLINDNMIGCFRELDIIIFMEVDRQKFLDRSCIILESKSHQFQLSQTLLFCFLRSYGSKSRLLHRAPWVQLQSTDLNFDQKCF